MTTKRDLDLFRKRLKELTEEGNPVIMGTPMGIFRIFDLRFSKPFYGKIGKNSFEITINNFFFPTPYIIEGDFKKQQMKKG